ncbi:hypothetical protein KXD40_009277 [Peronospora effusa]|nr:hypothetical protein KXD40_009277 [Peronospora effusa]
MATFYVSFALLSFVETLSLRPMAVVHLVCPLVRVKTFKSAVIGTMRVCGMPKGTCEKRLQKCMKAKCREIRSYKKREECVSTAKIFYIGANMVGCPAYENAQKEACECVPTDHAAFATRERVKYFLKKNGAPEADVEEEAIDALLEKYKEDEPTMFLRLLKKYPKALKTDLTKTNFMDDIVNSVDTDLKKKKKKGIQIEKEFVGFSTTSLTYSGLQIFTPYSFKLAARSSIIRTARLALGEIPSDGCTAVNDVPVVVDDVACDRIRWYCIASCVTSSRNLCATKEISRVLIETNRYRHTCARRSLQIQFAAGRIQPARPGQ